MTTISNTNRKLNTLVLAIWSTNNTIISSRMSTLFPQRVATKRVTISSSRHISLRTTNSSSSRHTSQPSSPIKPVSQGNPC
jgi:hypothetical protein